MRGEVLPCVLGLQEVTGMQHMRSMDQQQLLPSQVVQEEKGSAQHHSPSPCQITMQQAMHCPLYTDPRTPASAPR